jgi:anti-sigma factor RsiW
MDDQLLKRYLLGELPSDEQRRLEEVFFSEAQAFERLIAIEDDLIDDYVCGDLSRKQRERFEKHFLVSPERRERLALAKALVASVSEQPETVAAKPSAAPWWESILDFLKLQNPTIRFAMVAASLVFLIYGTQATFEINRLREQNAQLQKAQEGDKQTVGQVLAHNEQLQKEIATLRQQSAQSAQQEQELKALLEPLPYVLKAPARTRGGTSPSTISLELTRDTYLVNLQLEFDKATTYQYYRAILHISGGDTLWSQNRLSARSTNKANVVVVQLPPSVFDQAEEAVQEYSLTLLGTDVGKKLQFVERYALRVVKK